MNPTEIKQVLSELGGTANKGLGQHFLIDKMTLSTIVDEAEIEAGDRVLEVGPGLGVLTGALIEKGATVEAIERDRRFVGYLGNKLPKHLKVTQADAAKFDWDTIVGKGKWKFVSNLPYSMTSLALRKALYGKNPPTNLVVLIQREVAERILARDQKHSLVSLMVAFASHETQLVRRVAAGAFFPPPKVESAVLRVSPMSHKERLAVWGIDTEKVMAVAKLGFAHPRKFLSSNLGQKADTWLITATTLGLNPKARAEDLRPEDWVRLTLSLSLGQK
ncbi:16S rRNA (adenine(1518)-N(6)/adenine(1519)-N(6))-dimethyltransferase RsmA [Candidatus Uhrbacteria bacterium]|nr:16S rRNA (adenine(1518)-N(6)/adenine(1519)-N(6))-dimethyltransferase RsmA [Candidatus Uhrbacteria bacterium]